MRAVKQTAATWTAPCGNWAYWVSQGIVWSVLSGFVRRRLYGFQNVTVARRQHGTYLLAANHISHFDGPILTMTAPGAIDWLTDQAFFSPRPLGAWMRKSGGLPVYYDARVIRTVREARRRLRSGRVLGIFPDGGIRSEANSILEGAALFRGAAWLAVRENVPVIPCVILGTDRLYVRRNWQPWRGRVPVWIGFGPAILPGEWATGLPDLLGERLRSLHAEMRDRFLLQPADLPTTAQNRWAQAREK